MSNYSKELLSSSFNVNGKPVPWVALGGNRGYITVETGSELDVELAKIVGKMGVIQITDEELDAKKKNFPYVASKLNRFGKSAIQVIKSPVPKADQAQTLDAKVGAAVAAAVEKAVESLTPSTGPKLGKLKPVPAAA